MGGAASEISSPNFWALEDTTWYRIGRERLGRGRGWGDREGEEKEARREIEREKTEGGI